MAFKQFLEQNNLSYGEAAKIIGLNKSTVSRIANKDYRNWEQKGAEIMEVLKEKGYTEAAPAAENKKLTINTDAIVRTKSVDAYKALADDLSNPESTLSSSLGMVIGKAERGKSFTSKWYTAQNPSAVYVLFIDGSSVTQMLRDICDALANTRPFSLGKCISVLEQTCRFNRRLVIIDEADKCPVKHLETLRGINERCNLPFLFVGEEGLKSKVDYVPRLRSRVRNPVVIFEPAKEIEIATYYQSAAGLRLDVPIVKELSKRARGGFRTIANEARALANIANASGLQTITPEMLEQL